MPELVDQLAELTGSRDRDVLDTTLATALRELLDPRCVSIVRCVGPEGAQRWLTRARLGRHDVAASADPIWADLEGLPGLADFPHRQDALTCLAPVLLRGPPAASIFPLASDREVVGVVEIESDEPLPAAARRLVTSILRIYRNIQGLLDYSERDTLTGLLNRKTFDEAFYKLSTSVAAVGEAENDRRAHEGRLTHYVGVIDIDHFKSVNDTWGHLIGDEVLLLLSRLMRSSFRFHDRLFRYGGEEFVVLVRCGGDADAGVAFERLRANVQGYVFPQVGQITVSIGYTAVRPGDSPNATFERADRAVYWAKAHGRNQICSHADLVARGEVDADDKVGDVELF